MIREFLDWLFGRDTSGDCPVCGYHPFSGIRDEGCFDPRTNCPRTTLRW